MENFRLSHFSVIVLKAMIKQRLFFKKKIVEFYLHCLCLQNWGQWAVQEPHANILTFVVGITPISPQIWLVWRVKSSRALNFFRCTDTFKCRQPYLMPSAGKIKVYFHPSVPRMVSGWDHPGALCWPQLCLGDFHQVLSLSNPCQQPTALHSPAISAWKIPLALLPQKLLKAPQRL